MPAAADNDADVANDEYDSAAPNPTVPGGPRTRASNASFTRPPPDPSAPPASRNRSNSKPQSLKSASGRTKQPSTPRQQPPPLPIEDLDAAPAPSVGYGKSKDDLTRGLTANGYPQAKEKQGFFRRVFGGSTKSTTSLNESTGSNSRLPSSASHNEHPMSSKLQQQNQSKSTLAPPSRETSSSHSHHAPPLQKKTSSFFRRRKKSVADETPPMPTEIPPVPVASSKLRPDGNAASNDPPSPTSSLRQAMNPYLRNSAGSANNAKLTAAALADITNTADDKVNGSAEKRDPFQREFSPDYEPSPQAKIRVVPGELEAQTRGTPNGAADGTKNRFTKNNSFLDLDGGSDAEDEPAQDKGRQWEASMPSKTGLPASQSDPTSVSQRRGDKDDTIRIKKSLSQNMEPANGDTRGSRTNLKLPADSKRSRSPASVSTDADYKTAPSAPPSVRVEDLDEPNSKTSPALDTMPVKGLDEPAFVVGEPTAEDRYKAGKIYNGSEDFIPKEKAAAWMGEEGPVRKRTLQAYMELYNFTDQSILSSLRSICERLVLRAETQQVDRILVAFSKRWCACNPHHGFKATDVIHTICYSIMLLNTDLHLADIEQKMTRSQFVKNTISTIRQALLESKPEVFQRPSVLPEKSPMLGTEQKEPMEQDKASFRNSFRPSPRLDMSNADGAGDSGPLVKTTFSGSVRAWEEQVEQVLKGIYASIRDDRLPLFGADGERERHLGAGPSQNSLSVSGMLKRTPSVLSKTPSEGQMSSRGRIADSGRSGSRWTSKSRSRPGLGRTGMASSRTSFDDDNSLFSPAMSSATWSRYSLGRTQGSVSQDSFASAMPRGDYQQSIGFANALSQSIIRDEDLYGNETAPSIISSEIPASQLLEDESLELAGPPWVKEGMVVHKHHLDILGKRAKDRNWSEVFAVIQKGQMSLFSFNMNKSTRARPRTGGKITTPVGGGNWQDNAVNVGTFNLRLTLASALPAPGYSRTRPYVWALSLPTGAVHLFHVGTPEIIKEFVNTANYWSARLSTHPLVGGISNIEYGWSEAIVNNALVAAINESGGDASKDSRSESRNTHTRKSSVQSGSFRSLSFDQGGGPFTHNSGRGKLPGDRVHITAWAPPTQSARPSNLPEAEQRESLIAYVKGIDEELQAHNQLRSPMLLAFTPRGQNASKAMANWERKSSYLLREIVKFRTYLDCLQQSEARKQQVYEERDLARRAATGELSDPGADEEEDEGDETLRPE